MATTTTKKTEEENTGVKLVELRVPRGSSNEDPNEFISVNGVNYLIPRGKTVKVPDFVAAEYRRGESAKEAYFDTMDELSSLAE